MGFNGVIVSESGHYEEFVCAICQQLVDLDESTITSCSHVFCSSCISNWLKKQKICPTCKNDLSYAYTSELPHLKVSNPLAWRILSRVKVMCPMNCGWQGDYSEYDSHLTSSSNHLQNGVGNGSSVNLLNVLIEEARDKVQSGSYASALNLYNKAIGTFNATTTSETKSEVYEERAQVNLLLGKEGEGFEDIGNAISQNSFNINAWIIAKMFLTTTGKFFIAKEMLEAASSLHEILRKSSALENAKKEAQHAANMYEWCSVIIAPVFLNEPPHQTGDAANLLLDVPATIMKMSRSSRALVMGAMSEVEFGTIAKATNLALQALKKSEQDKQLMLSGKFDDFMHKIQQVLNHNFETNADSFNELDVYLVLAKCNFYNAEFAEAMKFVKQVLQLDPDYPAGKALFKIIKSYRKCFEDADKLVATKEFEKALEIMSSCLTEYSATHLRKDTTLCAMLHAERGNIYFRLNIMNEALNESNEAIKLQNDCRRAWLTKIYVLQTEEKYEQALNEISPIMEQWGQSDSVLKGAYEKTLFLLKKSKRPDYYKILSSPAKGINLSSLSSEVEIKNGYKRKALEVHPDTNVGKNTAEQEELFKVVGEAFEVLSDPAKRKLYDQGYDKEGIDEEIKRASHYRH